MNEQSSKEVTLNLVLSWIFGLFFAFIGFVSIFSEPLSGLFMLIVAAVLLPPVTRWVEKERNVHLSKGLKTLIIVSSLIVLSVVMGASDVTEKRKTEIHEKESAAKNRDILDEGIFHEQVTEDQSQAKVDGDEQGDVEIEVVEESLLTPTETISQKNAVRSAKAYLDYSAFSREGLIEQLEYEQFPYTDAVYGVDNSGADWYEQAAKSAKTYLDYSAFSRGGLIEQLKYEGFTQAQAEYGVDSVGL
jgi:hypothetical protein